MPYKASKIFESTSWSSLYTRLSSITNKMTNFLEKERKYTNKILPYGVNETEEGHFHNLASNFHHFNL